MISRSLQLSVSSSMLSLIFLVRFLVTSVANYNYRSLHLLPIPYYLLNHLLSLSPRLTLIESHVKLARYYDWQVGIYEKGSEQLWTRVQPNENKSNKSSIVVKVHSSSSKSLRTG